MHVFQNAGPFAGSEIAQKMHNPSLLSIVHNAFYRGIDSVAITDGFIFIVAGILCYVLLCMRSKKSK